MRHVEAVDSVVLASDVELFARNTGLLDGFAGADLVPVVQGGIDVPKRSSQLPSANSLEVPGAICLEQHRATELTSIRCPTHGAHP